MIERVALITGAGGGLGSAMAACLMREGTAVVGIGRSAAPLEALKSRLAQRGRIAHIGADVVSPGLH